MLTFYIVNESSDPAITHAELIKIATALAHQQVDFASWWQTTPVGVTLAASTSSAPADACLVVIRDDLGVDGALGYHDVDALGRPRAFIGWGVIKANGGTISAGSNSLSAVISHELCEAAADPYATWWADMPDGVHELALEACDPVEGDSYEVEGVTVSNFVGPKYFSGEPGAAYDRMGTVTSPMTMSPGGYQILRKGGPTGQVSSVWGETFPEWKKLTKGMRRQEMPDELVPRLSRGILGFTPPTPAMGDFANTGAHVPPKAAQVEVVPEVIQVLNMLEKEPPTAAATPQAKAEAKAAVAPPTKRK